MIAATIARIVAFSARNSWGVIAAFLLLALASGLYFAENFAITTDSSQLLSPSLPWRQQEKMLDRAFPERTDQIIAVIDATTPEKAAAAAKALTDRLARQSELFFSARQPDGDPFFARNGLLFEVPEEIKRTCDELIRSQAFLGALAVDPSLRGMMGALSQALQGVRLKQAKLEDFEPPLVMIAKALEAEAAGRDPAFSWRALISARTPTENELRQFIYIRPKLDYDDLQPGGRATAAIREAITALSLTPDHGVKVRLTGPVALSDEEFATVADGAGMNGLITALLVLLILWLALRRARLIIAVLADSGGRTGDFGRGRPLDGRDAEPDLRRLRRAFRGSGRRFRHSVQRALSRRAAHGKQDRSNAAKYRDGGGRSAYLGGGFHRGGFLFFSTDRLSGAFRAWPDRRYRDGDRLCILHQPPPRIDRRSKA